VKVCALESSHSTCSVWSQPILPQRESREESLTGAPLSARLKVLLKEAEARCGQWTNKLQVSIDDVGLTTGYLEFPTLSSEQLQVALPTAIAREIPHSLNEVQIFNLVVPVFSGKEKHTGVFFMTLPSQAMAAHQALFTAAGYEVNGCEPSLLGLIRGLRRNDQGKSAKASGPSDQTQVVLDCGFRYTRVLLTRGGNPYYSRAFRLAGADFTYAYQMGEQISWAEAESHKRTQDASEQNYHLEPFMVRWLGEVRRSLDFATQKAPGLKPAQVLLTGGSSRWSGLDRRLSAFLELPVICEDWQALKPSSIAPGVESSLALYDTALGLVSKA
jgi:Tfp pilus assembly PilM family ATPase